GLSHKWIAETFGIRSETQKRPGLGGNVVSEQVRAVREAVKGLREIGLQHRPRRNVDVATQECLERGSARREKVDLEPPELRCSKRVTRIRGECDAPGKPGRDRERARVDRL